MESENIAQECWRCHSENVFGNNTCDICGASIIATVPGVQVANYPRYPMVMASQQPGNIQVPAGTHPVWLVVVLSIVFGGWAGMLVNRQYLKALIYGFLLGGILTFVSCGLAAIVWYPLTLIDAILVANKLNRGQAIKEWEFF